MSRTSGLEFTVDSMLVQALELKREEIYGDFAQRSAVFGRACGHWARCQPASVGESYFEGHVYWQLGELAEHP